MSEYRITFDKDGIARSIVIAAESDGEAIELFELGLYGDCEILCVSEISKFF